MTVAAVAQPVSYVASGSQATFTIPWRFLNAVDILVYIQVPGASPVLQSSSTYTLAGLANPGGGTVTFNGGNITAGYNVILFRNPNPVQDTDLQNQGSYDPTSVEQQFDLDTMSIQALATQISQSIRAPINESNSMVLPPAAVRALQFSSFDSMGNATTAAGVGTTPISTAMAPVVAAASLTAAAALFGVEQQVLNVAALRLVTMPTLAGILIATAGYSAAGDGGHGVYEWNAIDTTADNGGTIIQITGQVTGRWHLLPTSGAYNVKQFGATGLGSVDDTAAINAAITVAGNGAVYFPSGTYLVNSALVILTKCRLYGDGRSSILTSTVSGTIIQLGSAGLVTRLDGFTVDSLAFTSLGGLVQNAILLSGAGSGSKQNVVIRNCYFNGFYSGSQALPTGTAVSRSDYTQSFYTGGTWTAWLGQSNTPQLLPSGSGVAIAIRESSWTILIENNYIENCGLGIYADNESGPVDYLTIRNNTIITSAHACLVINSNNLVIHNNTIEFNYAGVSIFGTDLTNIHDNHFEGDNLHNIYLGLFGGGVCTNGRIAINKFQPLNGVSANQVNGIYMVNSDTWLIEKNTFNGVNSAGQTANMGWDIFTSSTNRITLDLAKESADGFIQVNNPLLVDRIVRKTGGFSIETVLRRLALPMNDGANGSFEPFFMKANATMNGLATGISGNLFTAPSLPTAKQLLVTGYAVQLVSTTGGGISTPVIAALVNTINNNIVRLNTVTLPAYMTAGQFIQANMSTDITRQVVSSGSFQLQVTQAGIGPTTYVITVYVWGFIFT
jgi:hypothetical protein